VATVTDGVTEEERRKLVRDNTLRVFSVNAPVTA
jgi:hypothetical protein